MNIPGMEALWEAVEKEGVPADHAPYVVDRVLNELTIEQCKALIEAKTAEAAEMAAAEARHAARRASKNAKPDAARSASKDPTPAGRRKPTAKPPARVAKRS